MKNLIIVFVLFSITVFAQTKPTKVDENTIQISKSKTTTEVVKYDYDFLVEQKVRITADLLAYTIARQKEIDEIDTLLLECKNLGIVGKPKLTEPIK